MCPQIPFIAFIYIGFSNTLSSHILYMLLAEKHCCCMLQVPSNFRITFLRLSWKSEKKAKSKILTLKKLIWEWKITVMELERF